LGIIAQWALSLSARLEAWRLEMKSRLGESVVEWGLIRLWKVKGKLGLRMKVEMASVWGMHLVQRLSEQKVEALGVGQQVFRKTKLKQQSKRSMQKGWMFSSMF
jgi:hypothetical protein